MYFRCNFMPDSANFDFFGNFKAHYCQLSHGNHSQRREI